MKIWLFRWDEPLPYNKSARLRRAGLLASKLTEHGHQVVWWTTNFDHFAKKHVYPADSILQYSSQLSIITLKCLKYQSNTSLVRLFSQAVIARHFEKMKADLPKPDLIIVHYPSINLAYAAVRYAKDNGIPVIVDVRDMWPDTFVRFFPKSMQPLAQLLLFRSFQMKNYTFKNADVLLSMSHYILEWATRSAQRSPAADDQVFYLGAPRTEIPEQAIRPEIIAWLDKNKTKFICAYVGTFGKSYNLQSVVRAARVLKETGRRDIAFILAGDGPDFQAVQKAADGLESVFLAGWVNAGETTAILQQASAALIPVNDTTPDGVMCNKLFDYAAQGKPVLSSVNGEMRDFIEKYQMGLYFQDDQELQLIRAIDELLDNPAKTAELSHNSRKIFDDQLNADIIYEKYARLAERILDDWPKTSP